MRIHAAALAALTAFTVLAASQTAGGTLASGPAVTVTPSVSGTIAAGRRLTLTGCDGAVARVLELTGLNQRLDLAGTASSAPS